MDPAIMIQELSEKELELRNELMEMEKQFNLKKEQYLKIQGALEALAAVGGEPQEG
tara:strand:+ start:2826 stop:2993 length:168 start_codon:yes stop_codon:yes gene_type:complete